MAAAGSANSICPLRDMPFFLSSFFLCFRVVSCTQRCLSSRFLTTENKMVTRKLQKIRSVGRRPSLLQIALYATASPGIALQLDCSYLLPIFLSTKSLVFLVDDTYWNRGKCVHRMVPFVSFIRHVIDGQTTFKTSVLHNQDLNPDVYHHHPKNL